MTRSTIDCNILQIIIRLAILLIRHSNNIIKHKENAVIGPINELRELCVLNIDAYRSRCVSSIECHK
jgi:hypothetical protein